MEVQYIIIIKTYFKYEHNNIYFIFNESQNPIARIVQYNSYRLNKWV